VKPFLLPPLNLIILAVVLVALRAWLRLPRRLPVAITVIAAWLLCTPLVGQALLALHQTYPPLGTAAMTREPGAIVVLSAGFRDAAPEAGGTLLDGLSLTRVLYAEAVQDATGLPLLVTGGRIRDGAPPIARVMAGFLRDRMGADVPWVEPRARSTWENAAYSAAMLRAEGIGHVYLVTHAWHMPRAVHAFRDHGLRVTPAPTGFTRPASPDLTGLLPSPGGLRASYYGLHEVFGRIAYRFYAPER
jgi:uncharacterized SAM-binding protein YcdF (DUF218 family)